MRRGRELARDPHVVERHHVVPMVARELQPEPHRSPGLQLEVVHRLVGDEHAVRVRREGRERHPARCLPRRTRRHRGRRADRRRVDPVEILQVVAHVREPVLHRLRRPRRPGGVEPSWRGRRGRPVAAAVVTATSAPLVSCASTRACARVRRVEDADRERERCGERHQHEPARQRPSLPRHRGRHDAGQSRARPVAQRRVAARPAASEAAPPIRHVKQRGADPEQQGSEQREVADGDRRHAFRREHDLVAAPDGLPVDEPADRRGRGGRGTAAPRSASR